MARVGKHRDLDTVIAEAIADRDVEALDAMLAELLRASKKDAETAFAPALEFKAAARNWQLPQEEGILGDVAVAIANKISRARRRIQYDLKVLGGFDGLRIVSDGDSWFQYPLVLRDIINVLSDEPDKAVLSVDGAGDEVREMLREKEYRDALAITNGHILLFSAGGNDLLGEGRFLEILKPYSANATPEELVKEPVLRRRIDAIMSDYRSVVRDVGTRHPGVVMIGHGYDITYPRRGGKWLGQALEKQRIPLDIGREIVGVVVDRFNEALAETARQFAHFRHIDLRGRVGDGHESWYDELHPKNDGYARAADAFRDVLEGLAHEMVSETVRRRMAPGSNLSPSSMRTLHRPRPDAMRTAAEVGRSTIVIDPGHGGRGDLACSSANNAVGPVHGLLERDLTLDVALRVKQIMDRAGRYSCILTRDRDVNVSGRDRADVARRSGAAAFVSIHFNGSTGHNAQGTETWIHTDADDRGASAGLCRAMQAAVRRATGLADRNSLHPPHFVKKAAFCVVNPASHDDETAAVLVEVSFLDRADEEQRLTRDSYKDEIAEAIVAGIETYLGAATPEAITEAAPASSELEDGVTFYSARSRQPDRAATRPVAERTVGRTSPPLVGAIQLFARPGDAPSDDALDDVDEFRRIAIGDVPDFASAAEDAVQAQGIVDTMFGDLEGSEFDIDAFGRFIGDLGLRHFSPIEFLFLGGGNQSGSGRCAGKNTFPSRDLWDNIARTARMLDEIRDRLGAPVKILSAYRSKDYNACVGGERGSLHMRFNAIDWTCASGRPERWLEIARAVRASRSEFTGGIGFYPDKRFIHIDTRGREANW